MDSKKCVNVPEGLGDKQKKETVNYEKGATKVSEAYEDETRLGTSITPCCDLCAMAKNCILESPQNAASTDGCKFKLRDENTLIHDFTVSCLNGDKDGGSSEDDKLRDRIAEALRLVYHTPSIVIYTKSIGYKLCDKCDGSGTYVGFDHVGLCEYCKGTGLVPKPLKPGFHYAYSIYSYYLSDGTCCHDCFVDDEDRAKEIVELYNERMQDLTINSRKGYAKVIQSDRLRGVDFGHFSVVDADGTIGENLLVIDTTSNKIVSTGDWETICGDLEIVPYMDIEYHSHGQYIVESVRNYNERYCVMTTAFADELYSQVFSNIAASITQHSSYNGVENLVIRYIEKYPTIQDVRNNLSKHLALQASQMYAVSGEYQKVINKIIKDFSLIGMAITRADAATIVDKSQLTTDEYIVIYNIEQYSAVGVFLAEYVLLLGEFSDLTDDDKGVN